MPKDPSALLVQLVASEKKFETSLHERLDSVLPALSIDLRTIYQKVWEENSSFAAVTYWALAPCLRIPAQQAAVLQTIQRWNAEIPAIEAAKTDVKTRMDLAKDKVPSTFDVFYGFVALRLWPFAIVFALALKFAKGIAALRA